LKGSILIADGAMGSMLYETVGISAVSMKLNSTEPEAVFRVQPGVQSKRARKSLKPTPSAPIASSWNRLALPRKFSG